MKQKVFISMVIMVALATIITIPSEAQSDIKGRMTTEIVSPLSVTEMEQLNFGRLTNGNRGGEIQVSPQGEHLTTGNVMLTDGIFSAGKFVLVGIPGKLVSVVLPQSPQKLHRDAGGEELTVDNFTSNVPPGGKTIRQSNGKTEISIGATLYVGNWSESPAGFYTGVYQVVFMYN